MAAEENEAATGQSMIMSNRMYRDQMAEMKPNCACSNLTSNKP
jgi:hypothetical protein